MGNAHIVPIVCAYRLFDEVLGLAKPDEMRFGGYAENGGQHCMVAEKMINESGYVLKWYLAEDQGYRPVRYQTFSNSELSTDVVMRYKPDAMVAWRLDSWTTSQPPRGLFSEEAIVGESVFSEPIPPELFEVPFPKGTHVSDKVNSTTYVEGETEPVPLVPKSSDEASNSAKRTRKEVPMLQAQPKNKRSRLWYALPALGGLVAVLYLVRRGVR